MGARPLLRSDRPSPKDHGRRTGRTRGVLRLVAAVSAGLLAAWLPAAGAAAAPGQPEGYVETAYGPLGPTDRDLLVRVRLAGLWEIPAGEQAMEKGTTEAIREIGHHISREHIELDDEVVAAAAELGVDLPDRPSPEQQGWLDEMDRASGEEFDLVFVKLLREAHGVIFPIIGYVRAGTRNEMVREFADEANAAVNRHLNYLESSGLVDYAELPQPPEPLGTQSRFLASNPRGVHPVAIWIVIAAAAVAGAVTMVRTIRPR